jgi:hypothetical protein
MSEHLSVRKLVATVVLSLGVASTSAWSASSTATHDHEHASAVAAPALTLDHGAKWEIDEALGKAMGNIRGAVAAALDQVHDNTLPVTGYKALAGTIRTEVAYIVSNCKLEPAADVQLHLIVADLLDAADKMDLGVGNDFRRDAAVQAVGALENYATYFNDTGWVALRH